VPPIPAPPETGCPQLRSPAATGTTVQVFHPHSINKRLTAHRRTGGKTHITVTPGRCRRVLKAMTDPLGLASGGHVVCRVQRQAARASARHRSVRRKHRNSGVRRPRAALGRLYEDGFQLVPSDTGSRTAAPAPGAVGAYEQLRPSLAAYGARVPLGILHTVPVVIPEVVRSAIVRACRDAFWYKDDVKALFVSAGTPERVWERHAGDDISKAKTERLVLSELVAMGESGARVQTRIAEELYRMDRLHPEAPDASRGRAALDDLRREVDKHRLLSDPDTAAAQQRRATAEQRERAVQARRDVLQDVHLRFLTMVKHEPTTATERQRRGYDFERLLVDLFAAAEITYKPP
jgi:hypothetical protein